MPEIPLSVGSKLELLLSLPNFRILPRTLTHLSAYAYCHVYTCILAIMTEAPRVLHFSAFIIHVFIGVAVGASGLIIAAVTAGKRISHVAWVINSQTRV